MVDEATSGVACVAGVVLDEATSEATSRVARARRPLGWLAQDEATSGVACA